MREEKEKQEKQGKAESGVKVPVNWDNHHGMTKEEHRQFLAENLIRTAVSYAEVPGMLKSVVVVVREKEPKEEGYKALCNAIMALLGEVPEEMKLEGAESGEPDIR